MKHRSMASAFLLAAGAWLLAAGCQTTPPAPLSQLRMTLANLQAEAVTHYELGEYRKALETLGRIELLTKGTDDLVHLANAYNNIGAVHFELRELPEALRHLELARGLLEGREEEDARDVLAETCLNLGSVYVAMGNQTKAEEWNRRAEEIFQALGNEGGLVQVLRNRAKIQESLSDFSRAIEMYSRALDRSRSAGLYRQTSAVLADLGGLRETMGEYDKALDLYRQALHLDKENEQYIAVAKNLRVLGRVCEKKGDLDAAWDYHGRALNVYRIRIGHFPWIAAQLRTLVRLARKRKDKPAEEEYARMLASLAAGGTNPDPAREPAGPGK